MSHQETTISITEASKHLGINRSKLNQIINKANIHKDKVGRVALVNLHEVQNLVQQMAAKGHIKTPTHLNQIKNKDNYLTNHLNDEIKRLSNERNELQEKVHSLSNENLELRGELKLLKSSNQEETKKETHKQPISIFEKVNLITQILTR